MNESHKLRAEGKKVKQKKRISCMIPFTLSNVQDQCILVVVARVVGALGK